MNVSHKAASKNFIKQSAKRIKLIDESSKTKHILPTLLDPVRQAKHNANASSKPPLNDSWIRNKAKHSSTLYAIIGVKPDADKQTIKKAFYKLSKKWHPDNADDDQKESYRDRYQDIKKAYNILTKKSKRDLYDATLAETFNELRTGGKDGRDTKYHAPSKDAKKYMRRCTVERQVVNDDGDSIVETRREWQLDTNKFNKGFSATLSDDNAEVRRGIESEVARKVKNRIRECDIERLKEQRSQLKIAKVTGKLTLTEFNRMFLHFNKQDHKGGLAEIPTGINSNGLSTQSSVNFGNGIDFTGMSYATAFNGCDNPTEVDKSIYRGEDLIDPTDTDNKDLNRKIKTVAKSIGVKRNDQLEQIDHEGYIFEDTECNVMMKELGLYSSSKVAKLNPSEGHNMSK